MRGRHAHLAVWGMGCGVLKGGLRGLLCKCYYMLPCDLQPVAFSAPRASTFPGTNQPLFLFSQVLRLESHVREMTSTKDEAERRYNETRRQKEQLTLNQAAVERDLERYTQEVRGRRESHSNGAEGGVRVG